MNKNLEVTSKLELLAPAQNKECAIAAINYGADAIYIGASSFGARNKAKNSLEDIKEVLQYAHKFGSKVYVTLNTILTDTELKAAQKLICGLYEIGVDAIIVQDMGILSLELPPIKIFASTQCNNKTLEKVKFFEKIGISRVILARELSLKEIENICKNTNIEIETFIHGALCVSYSGQCYLSYTCGGRSANRGECAQACRRKYTLKNKEGKILAKDKHLLSLKDLNATAHIDALVKAGVTSFKIEGRMKDVNYVKNVVGHYRKVLDNYKKTSSGKVFFDFEPKLEKSFNRGFCDYFLQKRGNISNFDTPKSLGEELGYVVEVGKSYFILSTDKKINPQDGLYMIEDGCLVNKVEGRKIFPNKMPKLQNGTLVFRNQDCEFEKILANSKTVRKLAIDFEVQENELVVVDEDNNIAKLCFDTVEVAQNQEKMAENLLSQLKKTGDSDFYVQNIKITASALPFLPVSKINELRREIFKLLTEVRLKNYKREYQTPIKPANYPIQSGDYRLNILNQSAKDFMQKCGCEVQEMALEGSMAGRTFNTKELMRCKHCIKWALNMCKSKDELYLVDDKNTHLKLKFDCKNCEMVILKEEEKK